MKFICALATLACYVPWGFAREPDAVFLRHARALIPEFLEAQSRLYETRLSIDLDSLRVEDLFGVYSRAGYLFPTRAPTWMYFEEPQMAERCRRVEGVIAERNVIASFFVRDRGSHFELTRDCVVDQTRSPLLMFAGKEQLHHAFSDAEIASRARPLVENLLRRDLPGVTVDPDSLRVERPWVQPRVAPLDLRGPGRLPPTDCRRVTFDVGGRPQRLSTSIAIAYDTDEILETIAPELQTLHHDARVLRPFRFALVRGCLPWTRGRAPRLRIK